MINYNVSLNVGGVERSFVKEEIIQPTFPTFGRIIHWHERYGVSYIAQRRIEEGNPNLHKGAGGDPAVFQLNQSSSDRAVFLTPILENWIFGLQTESCRNTLTLTQKKQAYRNLMRGDKAFTNKSGWTDGKQSVILNENMGAEQQRLQLTIANGATVKILGDKIRRGGEDVYPIEVMDAKNPNTITRTIANSWWMMFPATVSTVEPAPEGNVDPFPYLGDNDVIVPLLANNTTVGYVEAGWIELLGNITQPVYPYYRTWVDEQSWKSRRGLV